MTHTKHRLLIGIDAGVHTGMAIWDNTDKRLVAVDTKTITRAMHEVEWLATQADVTLYIEDARKRTWFGRAGREQLQGAGSIKRDCSIWQSFCEEQGIDYLLVAPRHNTTKLSAEQFKVLTNWAGRTSEHSRDAAMLVFGR